MIVVSARTREALGWTLVAACAAAGVLWILHPELLGLRFHPRVGVELGIDEFRAGAVRFSVGVGWLLLVIAAGLAARLSGLDRGERARTAAQMAFGSLAYLALVSVFWDWQIDDAAITWAYAENLVRGFGLVLHPSQPPEEAYSNTLWLLILAGFRALGAPVHVTSKVLSTLLGATTVVAVLGLARRLTGRVRSDAGAALVMATLLSAPFVVWSASGLEHVLQGLLFLALVASATHGPRAGLAWSGAALGALVLVRPEAPLIAASVAAVYAWERWRERRSPRDVLGVWPLAVFPAAVLAGLLLFRWLYFGDLLPNPYYAKATHATPLRWINLVGGGWAYVLEWFRSGGGFSLVPLLALARWRRAPFPLAVAGAIAAGQLAFVVAAGGDWMGQWRFLCALIPLLAVALAWALDDLEAQPASAWVRRAAWASVAVLVWCNAFALSAFRGHPTTPYREVARVGLAFVDLAERLGIEHPRLAHHDAGGTSYVARIDLVDLGGLGNRTIAKHLDDAAFLRRYVLEETRPDFVFGVTSFFAAKASGFHLTPEFRERYVRIRFEGRPDLAAPLCHVRRDRVREAPGVRFVTDAGGNPELLVSPSPPRD